MTIVAPPVAASALVALGCWTILDAQCDEVRATVTHEYDGYVVRDRHGVAVGTYPSASLALASVAD